MIPKTALVMSISTLFKLIQVAFYQYRWNYSAVRLKWTRLIWTIGYSERYAMVPIETLFIKLNG